MSRWLWRALRDWRVWALTFTIQAPGVRAIVRYAPWPAILLPIVIVISIVAYGACLHGKLARWLHRRGSRLPVVAGALCVVAAVNVFAYPKADALKLGGRGSDEDNALIEIAGRLVTGQRPIYVPTYLGNAPSAGLGWAALVAPLAVTHSYALLTPLSLGVLGWMIRRAGGGEIGTALAILLPLTSPGFWELSVTGSDLFAMGVLFTAVTMLVWSSRRTSLARSIVLLFLVLAAASSRVVFAYVTGCVSVFMWRTKRSGAALVAAATAVVLGAEAWLWWPDSTGVTPLYLISKLFRQLGAAGVAASVLAAIVSAWWALAQLDETIEAWCRALWMLLVVPLGAVSLGVLASIGWDVVSWQATSYVEVAVPAAAACIALTAKRPAGTSFQARRA